MEMMRLVNKPRVFLSHSKTDVVFIENLCDDLRRCQVDPWLDSEEIRHGKPWLEAIFENGIPTCDCVLLYFTENSLESAMVKKEMDAGIIHNLNDGGVAFLPYVSSEAVRTKLRMDIQALQVPVWNRDNYKDLLPRVVAEVWRSFLERTVKTAVQNEQVKRLQAELELQKLSKVQSKLFTDVEDVDFSYIWDSFDRNMALDIRLINGADRSEYLISFTVNCKELISQLADVDVSEYSHDRTVNYLMKLAKVKYLSEFTFENGKDLQLVPHMDNVKNSLLMFGLVESHYTPPPPVDNTSTISRIQSIRKAGKTVLLYTPKMHRFRYWLAHNKLLRRELNISKSI